MSEWLTNGFHFDLAMLAVLLIMVALVASVRRTILLHRRQQRRLERAMARRQADRAARHAYLAELRDARRLRSVR